MMSANGVIVMMVKLRLVKFSILLFHLKIFTNFLRLVKVFGVNPQDANISQSARYAAISNVLTTNLSSSS